MLVNCMVYCRGEKLDDIALENLGDYLRLPDHFVCSYLFYRFKKAGWL